jgi:uncharacterized repeat protein (TIGR01451 family)
LTFSQITNLSAVYSFPVGHYGGGSPRFEIAVDTNGDGTADGDVFVYFGTPPTFINPGHTTFVSTGNFILDTSARWDLSQFGGGLSNTYAQALAFFAGQPSSNVEGVSLVVDGSFIGNQAALVDSFTVNNSTYTTRCQTDLSITKINPAGVALKGQPVTYNITVTNHGPTAVTSVKLVDVAPPEIDSTTISYAPSSGSYNPSTGQWTGLNLTTGASASMKVTGKVQPTTTSTSMTNAAIVFPPASDTDPSPINNTTTDTSTIGVGRAAASKRFFLTSRR